MSSQSNRHQMDSFRSRLEAAPTHSSSNCGIPIQREKNRSCRVAFVLLSMFATNLTENANGKMKHMRLLTILLLTVVSVFFTMGETSLAKKKKKKVLDVNTNKNLKAQGLTEGFFESVEPSSDELSMVGVLKNGQYKLVRPSFILLKFCNPFSSDKLGVCIRG
jgi:hypothetical protein